MSEYFYWPYRLNLAWKGQLNAKTPFTGIDGALLRHQDGGHACLQPWPALGQGDLEDSLSLLRDGGSSDLLAACQRCMALDGAARRDEIGLFEGKIVPRSHLTVPDLADFGWLGEKFSDGFEIFKLKCGEKIGDEVQRVAALIGEFGDSLTLRLDFNECLDLGGFERFVDLLGNAVEQIDFIEDPLPYDAETWGKLQAQLPFDLAVDLAAGSASETVAVRVVKPAWEPTLASEARTVFTSAMDHPLGQLFAAHEAAVYDGGVDDCGLLTHWLFEPDDFSELLGLEDRRLVAPGGAGLGYGELLDALPWRAL